MYRTLLTILLSAVIFAKAGAQEISEFIHVDQFGYTPEMTKVAVLSNPQVGYNSGLSYQAPSTIELRDASTNTVVLTLKPQVWNGGATHDQSGDQGWWVDFTALTTVGDYYLQDTVNNERSATFKVSEMVYEDVMRAAGRMFYYNRCGLEKTESYAEGWSDGANFGQDSQVRYIYDQGNASLEKDLSGGWFDAGDYNKYVTFASGALNDLLSAYEENPQAFSDAWNIPESGNEIPDLLDEIKWELDFLLKMNQPDGSTILKMGSRNYSENTASPPSANTDTRYYRPTCASASIAAAGMFAHAAKVFQNINGFESYASLLLERAITSYAYVQPFVTENTLDTACDDGSIVAGDADRTVTEQQEEFVLA